jgi:hypothetical protein
LRDVRFHARQPFGQLAERERIASVRQLMQRRKLRQRQADLGQPRFDACLERVRRMKNRK